MNGEVSLIKYTNNVYNFRILNLRGLLGVIRLLLSLL